MATEPLRVRLYRQLAATGRVASRAELVREARLARELGAPDVDVPVALAELAEQRHLVLDARGEIVLAHPFATRDFGFSVKSADVLWWGGCAWDSFAIPHLVDAAAPALVATTCPACRTAHAWLVGVDEAPPGDQVAHFLVPMARVWDDVVHACEHQQIFCDGACVDSWLEQTGQTKGWVLDLPTLWRLAQHWYAGRLAPGYRRREPAEAADYFRNVGLVGAFWGNGS